MTDDSRVLSGRYRIDESIGRGGMASVYRGYDLTLGRDVAIKILDPELARDAGFRTRFRLEAQAASRDRMERQPVQFFVRDGEALLDEQRKLFRPPSESTPGEARTRMNLATTLWERGRPETARALVDEVVQQFEPVADPDPILDEARVWLEAHPRPTE